MSYPFREDTKLEHAMRMLTECGFDGMANAIEMLLNEAMLIEREQHLNAGRYERTEGREGYANGFKPKSVQTRIGKLNLQVPQTRDSDFYPSSLEKGIRSERALKAAVAEMYINGVSTRKVKKVTQELCGLDVTSAQVSKMTSMLDEELEQWRNRPLGSFRYLVLDARYENVRHGKSVVDSAVLIAYGVDSVGKRRVLGVSVSLSEAEVHWREFLESLVTRGLHGIEMIVSDAHPGLKCALNKVYPSVPWQRCQFHIQQNAQAYVPKKSMKSEVASVIRAMFNASNCEEAKRLQRLAVERYHKTAPDLANWIEANVHQGFTVFSLPESHWKKLRTSNMAERVNEEIKRRTRVVSIFGNKEACLRLVTALLIETDEEWLNGNSYLKI